MSDEIRIGTGQVVRAALIVVVSAAATVAQPASALVGVVDQAKGREVASCQASGRSDCLATVGGAL